MADNAIHITGNLTRDPELRFTNSGTATASFGVAVNTRKKNSAGDFEDGEAQFFDVTAFGSLAENVSESLVRGTRVTLNGKLSQRSWEADDGSKRSKIEVIADSVGPDLRWATAQVTKVSKQ